MSNEPSEVAQRPSLICPKCDGEMERGFIPDEAYGHYAVSEWGEGPPQKSFVFGLFPSGIKSPKEPLPIATFRCSSCGYLESYARPEFKAT